MPASEPIGEMRRLALIQRLTEVLGEEEAATIMESLPPTFWQNLATKDDLKAVEERLCTQFNAEFAKVHAQFDKINGKFTEVNAQFDKINGKFTEVNGKFTEVDGKFTKIEGEFALVRGEMEKNKGEIALLIANQTRTLMITLVGFALSIWISLLVVGIT